MQDTDAIDRTILSILSREARIPMKSLAGRIGLSRSATTERVTAAFEILRAGGQQHPNLRQFIIPCFQRRIEVIYDPVST